MISVTVAANGKSRRCVGAHLRVREFLTVLKHLEVVELMIYIFGHTEVVDCRYVIWNEKQMRKGKHENVRSKTRWTRLWEKLSYIIIAIIQFCFPALFRFLCSSRSCKLNLNTSSADAKSTCVPYSSIQKFPNDILTRIFRYLDYKSLLNCELTCKRWNCVVEEHMDVLPKLPTDQIRLLFDEAEVFIYPIDEKKCPVRYDMPSLQGLERRLRHLTTQSLFVRGLIPVESAPVFRSLLSLSLRPQQIYFIWSNFSPISVPMLEKFLFINRETVTDLGLEECSPPHLFTDQIFDALLPGLTCVRVWNDGKSGNYAISDNSIYKLANAIADGYIVETIDLASCVLTESSLSTLVVAWVRNASSDLCISLNYCPLLNKNSLYEILAFHKIYLTDGKHQSNGYCLTLFC